MKKATKIEFTNRVEYIKNGQKHREDGPAVIYDNGTKKWYLDGKRHREDGPAIIYDNGDKMWYKNGELHREDGPAIVWADGTKKWYLNGERHREDGPAFEYSNGDKFWYLNGVELTEEEFNNKMNISKDNVSNTDNVSTTFDGEYQYEQKLYTSINEFKKALNKKYTQKINESVPYENDIKDVFPDIDTQELKTMFYGSGYEDVDIDEIRDDIIDDIKTVFDELEEDNIDYRKMSQSEFMDELEKRIEPLHPRHEKLYSTIFKELITDPNQLELKFEAIKEYFGGAKKGVNIWKFEDLEDTIKSLLKNGVEKESLLDKINSIINSIDVVEKPELSHVVESNNFLPKIGDTVEQIVLTKYFDKAYIYFTHIERPLVIEGDFEHLENHPDIMMELDPPKLDEAKKTSKGEKALSIVENQLPRLDFDMFSDEIIAETGERGPRLDHGGGEDGDDWMEDHKIEEVVNRYRRKWKRRAESVIDKLAKEKIKADWDILIGEKGHIELLFIIP